MQAGSTHSNAGAADPHGGDLPRTPLSTLVRQCFDFVWRTLRRYGLSPSDADDAAQQVFLVLADKWVGITPGRERAFLFGTAVRIASRARRSQQRRRENFEAVFDTIQARGDDPEQAFQQREATEMLNAILDTMPDELRDVFILFEVEQLTMNEIHTLLEVPHGTVASRLRRAREHYERGIQRVQAAMATNRGDR
jgi:RNA polymerase sigma-70 factor (ECF subfamily)